MGKKEGVFQGFRFTESDVEKRIAEISPLGFVLASKRCMVGIRCGDDKCISICQARNEDARIAGRNYHGLMLHARLVEHLGEIGWLQRISSPPRCDGKPSGEPCDVRKRNRMFAWVHLFALSSDLHGHLWQEVRDDELRHALYGEGDGVAAGPLSKRVDQCNGQLARSVLCGSGAQYRCGSHGARFVAADATPGNGARLMHGEK